MAAISQILSNAFSWMKMLEFLWQFNCFKFVPRGPVNNIPPLVQKMAWGCPANKPLFEPMMVNYQFIYASLNLNELMSPNHLHEPMLTYHYTPPAQRSCWGYTGFTPSVRLSIRLSIRPSHILCPLCSAYSSCWIYFIFIHLIKQLQTVCRM